jgi:hypothetical protein
VLDVGVIDGDCVDNVGDFVGDALGFGVVGERVGEAVVAVGLSVGEIE